MTENDITTENIILKQLQLSLLDLTGLDLSTIKHGPEREFKGILSTC